MNFIPYNSQKDYHKYPFGAVRNGTEVTMRIVLPRELNCNYAYLTCCVDDRAEEYQLQWEGMGDGNTEWWHLSFTPEAPGVCFYYFRLVCGGETKYISKVRESYGNITDEIGDKFQLTVFDKNFETPGHIKGGVIYQIFPDRFCFSGKKKADIPSDRVIRTDWGEKPLWQPDENGKISKYDFFQGDLRGVEEKLDYIKSLGTTVIYLNPIFSAVSNHRYDTADYEKIDCLLGDEKDLKRLCKKAKEKGIDIILDGVFSHTGADSRYFNKFGTYGKGGAFNDKSSPYFSWYKFKSWPDDYESWWGVDILPEVNEENENFLEYIGGIVKKYMSLGVSGWRLDVADELPDAFLDSFRQSVKKENKDGYILGEVWEDASNKISYSSRRRYLLGSQLDSVMNYPFADVITDFAISGVAEGFNSKIMTICENYPKPALDCLMNHVGTHDTCRIISRLGTGDRYQSDNINRFTGEMNDEQINRGKKLLEMVSILQFTLPGIPCIYYGDEAGLTGGVDPYNRGCYPYGREDEKLLSHYRFLAKIRSEHKVFREGAFVPISSVLGCVAYAREDENEKLIIVANNNSEEIDYVLPHGQYKNLLGGKVNGNHLFLPAESAAIVMQI